MTTHIESDLSRETLLKAFRLMNVAKSMADLYDENRAVCSRYVHSTSRGHEAIQLATALQLKPYDYLAPYYRDDSMLLGIGLQPHELMMQLMAKANDPFSGGRTYYCHPSLRREGMPTIPHQSSATGMQAIPATGLAHAVAYLENQGLAHQENKPIVVCSIGDGAMTEGEVAEALQMAVLKQLPILYLVQDNEWAISATREETRRMDAFDYADGFKGLERRRVKGSDFAEAYAVMHEAIHYVRHHRAPMLVCAKVPLLGHHTSGVRREWYRNPENLEHHATADPLLHLYHHLLQEGVPAETLAQIVEETQQYVQAEYEIALASPDPDPATATHHEFAPTPITEEKGNRCPEGAEKTLMVDAALHAVDDILAQYPEALFYGQDVGPQLGGVFREAALLAKKYGNERVFNTPIQEAYIVGSTAGMSAAGAKPIVEIQFADYIWPSLNQLVEELSKSCYLSKGQFPIQSLIRVPIGAYGSGGPYHSGSIESTLLTIKGIKVVYPSNAADMKGLMKAAFLDPNPVVMLEHKGLYWSKVPDTEEAKTLEPDADYILPLGKANVVQAADAAMLEQGETLAVITYGMGVYWTKKASKQFAGQVEIIDLRTLYPLDWETVQAAVKRHGKVLIVTEEPLQNSFAESLAGRISRHCFKNLDAPVFMIGAENVPAIPLNSELEKAILPNADKVKAQLQELLEY